MLHFSIVVSWIKGWRVVPDCPGFVWILLFFGGGDPLPQCNACIIRRHRTSTTFLLWFNLHFKKEESGKKHNYNFSNFLTNAAFTLTIPLVCIFNLRNRYLNIQKRDQKKLLAWRAWWQRCVKVYWSKLLNIHRTLSDFVRFQLHFVKVKIGVSQPIFYKSKMWF